MVDLLVYTNHRMGDMYYNTGVYISMLGAAVVLVGPRASGLVGVVGLAW
jgi:hypothetical protein